MVVRMAPWREEGGAGGKPLSQGAGAELVQNTFSFLRALNFFSPAMVSCRLKVDATRCLCWCVGKCIVCVCVWGCTVEDQSSLEGCRGLKPTL